MKIAQRSLITALVGAALTACAPSRHTVASKAPTDWSRAFSRQGMDAVLYQNASAEAYRLYQQCYDLAEMKLEANLAEVEAEAQMGGERDQRQPAVIVDVDETVLDNSPFEIDGIANGLTYTPDRWKEWTRQASARALPGSVGFLQDAVSRGCAVYYITNRDADEKSSTMQNLSAAGFPMVDSAHVMTREDGSDKTARRARVSALHRVVLLVGDQLTDFDERFKDRSVDQGRATVDAMADSLLRYFVLLPNPMYGVWRDAVSGSGRAATDSSKVARMNAFFERRDH